MASKSIQAKKSMTTNPPQTQSQAQNEQAMSVIGIPRNDLTASELQELDALLANSRQPSLQRLLPGNLRSSEYFQHFHRNPILGPHSGLSCERRLLRALRLGWI